MSTIRLKAGLLFLAVVCLAAVSARADSATFAVSFTGNATFGNDFQDFFLSGPSLNINSAAPGATAIVLFTCNQGSICDVPDQVIGAFPSYLAAPGAFSGGTVRAATADTLTGSRHVLWLLVPDGPWSQQLRERSGDFQCSAHRVCVPAIGLRELPALHLCGPRGFPA
jgi:hypothetical protein